MRLKLGEISFLRIIMGLVVLVQVGCETHRPVIVQTTRGPVELAPFEEKRLQVCETGVIPAGMDYDAIGVILSGPGASCRALSQKVHPNRKFDVIGCERWHHSGLCEDLIKFYQETGNTNAARVTAIAACYNDELRGRGDDRGRFCLT